MTNISAYTGESVLLPCYCTDLHTTPKTFTWKKDNMTGMQWEEISSESGQYRDRVQLVNGHSPGNLSLLISHLTEEDTGDYLCDVKDSGHIFTRLTIKGCILVNSGTTIAAHTGRSVLLPCYCTDPHTKPKEFNWLKYNQSTSNWDRIPLETEQYRDRVQLVNGHSPGNLSLLISHLTEEDGGDYMCDAMKSGFIYIRLTVEGNLSFTDAVAEPLQSLPFVPFALVTVIILHIIVAVVYHTKRNKGNSTDASVAESPQSLPFVPFALVTVIFLHIILAVVYHTKRNKECT
ncbi:V-set and immunoglobulin domain-containing protein 1-like [Colossoma macropomum]|uniref:V-set and immunoglobulin domain-containing protein 1-like n=1 Tax=Colossoma macropomum TaxID=42526 RepID=UPI001863DAE3|nr:V-set and immunoglobulin domain-containing protein 1-like [Colossoma macropomum]